MNPVVQLGQGVDGVSAWEQHDRQVSVMGPSVMDNLKVHLVRSGADVVEEEPVSDHPVETHGLFNVCVPRDPSIHPLVNWELCPSAEYSRSGRTEIHQGPCTAQHHSK